jgi:hypothetical protein
MTLRVKSRKPLAVQKKRKRASKVTVFVLQLGYFALFGGAVLPNGAPVVSTGFRQPYQRDLVANYVEESNEALVRRGESPARADLAPVRAIDIQLPVDLLVFQTREVLREVPGSQERRSSLDRPNELRRDRLHVRLRAGE